MCVCVCVCVYIYIQNVVIAHRHLDKGRANVLPVNTEKTKTIIALTCLRDMGLANMLPVITETFAVANLLSPVRRRLGYSSGIKGSTDSLSSPHTADMAGEVNGRCCGAKGEG